MFDLYLLESHEVMYHVKFLRWMKTENLSLCLEWKGHLSVSANFQKKKKKKWTDESNFLLLDVYVEKTLHREFTRSAAEMNEE